MEFVDLKKFRKILDVGCGPNKAPGAVGIDKIKHPHVDLVWDLDQIPWPLADQSFDLILAKQVLEHLTDVPQTMREFSRVLQRGGHLIITAPYFRNVDAFSDITHKHFFTSHSLDYFISDTKVSGYQYADLKLKLVRRWLGWPGASRSKIRGVLKSLINKYSDFYEKYLAYFYPVKMVAWEFVKEY